MTPEGKINFFLDEDENFKRPGVPTTKDEYIRVWEASLKFITLRGNRMVDGSRRTTPTLRSDGHKQRLHQTLTTMLGRRLILRTLRRSLTGRRGSPTLRRL